MPDTTPISPRISAVTSLLYSLLAIATPANEAISFFPRYCRDGGLFRTTTPVDVDVVLGNDGANIDRGARAHQHPGLLSP